MAGLDREACGALVELCLDVAKRMGGWDRDGRDSGYGSGSGSGTPVRDVAYAI